MVALLTLLSPPALSIQLRYAFLLEEELPWIRFFTLISSISMYSSLNSRL